MMSGRTVRLGVLVATGWVVGCDDSPGDVNSLAETATAMSTVPSDTSAVGTTNPTSAPPAETTAPAANTSSQSNASAGPTSAPSNSGGSSGAVSSSLASSSSSPALSSSSQIGASAPTMSTAPVGSAAGGSDGPDVGTGGDAHGGAGGQTTAEGVGGQPGAAGGQPGAAGGSDGLAPSGCVGSPWPSANPTSAGPFEVAADKGVGPLAGAVPDPIYGDQQQRYNVYRPANLAQSEYCHPILIWANGYTDNPEPNPPSCVVDSGANKWCGQYLPLMNHLASHGFVVVASLSTATAEGDPLPTIAGLDWILEQAEDSSSPYYHRLDTANIGQLGHSYGGMSTCMSASEPRYKALATICGTRALSGVHTPMLFFCGGKDDTVDCAGVRDTFLTVKEQPAFFIKELNADHGSWVYQGANGVSLSMAAAWFRAQLMGDTESRKYFYGAGCTFCTDSRVAVEQNSLMAE